MEDGVTLSSLAKKYHSDKYGKHFYTTHYEKYFSSYRQKSISIFEIGVGGYADPSKGGASLRMWKEYFPLAKIYGLDYYEKSGISEDRIQIFQGSQVDPIVIAKILQSTKENKFDIVLDDGSHRSEHVIASFQMLFQYVSEDGLYVIEDTQTSYWPRYGGSYTELNDERTTMSFFKRLIDGLNWEEIHRPKYSPNYCDVNISAIHFYHNLIIIEKGKNREGSNTLKNNEMPT